MYTPYRKKKFKNSSLNKLHEKYVRTKKKLESFFRKSTDKGHERITLMLIPHSEKKIFNIQISNFTIIFFSIAFSVIILFSIISMNSHEANETQITNLSNISRIRKGQILAFKERTHFTFKKFSLFKKEIKKLAGIMGIKNPNTVFPIYAKGGIDYSIDPEMQKKFGKNFSFPNEVKELDNLNKNVMKSTESLKRVNSFIKNMKKVLEYTPSLWPVQSGRGLVTSPFGYRRSPFTGTKELHPGYDVAWWPGSPIQATASGTIVYSSYMGGYGLCIMIRHKYGFTSLYGHLQNTFVKLGQHVKKGQRIGLMGNSGRSTGYHIHYEIRLGTTPINPHPYMIPRFEYGNN